ncbi:LAFA_0F21880g1_1 [Lachancea sp. 'fantastica']|nr:LAFA_0F21880g1_1 [Lachancea sp. 'fantastica']
MSRNWSEAQDPKGRVYYYHTETGETTWEKPIELFTEFELQLHKHGWKAAETEEGQTYYYNEETGKSSWEVPTFSDTAEEAPSLVNSEITEDKVTETPVAEASTHISPESKDLKSLESYHLKSKLVESNNQPRADAERIFLQMLADHQIDSTWSFNRIISELGSSDPRYWCVDDDPLWKRKMFEQYLANRTEDQLLKEHSAVNKFKDAFCSMLEQHSQIKYYTRWSTAKRLFAKEPIYKHSVVSERTKRAVFQEFVDDLRTQHFGNVEKTKQQAIVELKDYLSGIIPDKEHLISWPELSNSHLFENSTRFTSNKHFQTLSRYDVLQQYVNLVDMFSKKLTEDVEQAKAVNYTSDRKARDRFRQLLADHNKEIRCTTKWEDIYPSIKSDLRFKSLLGRSGSSALDLFLDQVEEKALIMKAQQSIANQILIDNSYEWDADPEVNTSKLTELLSSQSQLLEIDKKDLVILISKLLAERDQKLARQLEMEHRLSEQRKNYFNLLLQRVFSSAGAKPKTFDEARGQLADHEEYRDLGDDDETRKRLFEAFEPTKIVQQHSSGTTGSGPVSKLLRKRQMTPVEMDY